MGEIVKSGDKVVVVKELEAFGVSFADEGDGFEVTKVDDNSVYLHGCNGSLTIDMNTFNEHFKKKVEDRRVTENLKDNMVTEDMIMGIIENSKFIIDTVFDKCTVVSCRLPNGFVITESSACVDPANYDEDTGADICISKIIDKVWELEGYRVQNELYVAGYIEDDDDCDDDDDDDDDDDCECCPERYTCEYYNSRN